MDNRRFDMTLAYLESLVRQLVVAHQQLGELLQQKREALMHAEHERILQLTGLEHEKITLITTLEKERLAKAGELTLALDPQAAEPMKLNEIAERLAEPKRGRLLVLRQQLRDQMQEVQRTSSVTRRATESLVKHMHGLVQTIGAVSTGVTTYSSKGHRPDNAMAIGTMSVTA